MLGLIELPWWGYVLVLLTLAQITIFSVTIFLHRAQAHRALHLHPAASHFFRFWLWLTTGMITKEWTAIHRKHHAKVETKNDPHSPQIFGIKKVFLEGAELYKEEAKNRETIERYGDGTPDDWMERNIYTRHSNFGIIITFIVLVVLFGFIGITLWALLMASIPFFAAGVVNGVGHYWGYRNFESKDASRNIVPIGIFIGGEELHNNHHAFTTSAKFSTKWWEIDIGWGFICLLSFFGLAKPKRVVPRMLTQPSKKDVDVDTLKALISYRLQVMSRYSREVIFPALQEEKKRAGKAGKALLFRAHTLLKRESSLLKSTHKLRLSKVLDNFHSLRTVYQYRLRLQEIWMKSSVNQKELVDALQEWCRQAEASGIETLRRFTQRLKTYVPAPARG